MASEAKNSNVHFLSCEVLKYMFFGMLDPFPTLFLCKIISYAVEAAGGRQMASEA